MLYRMRGAQCTMHTRMRVSARISIRVCERRVGVCEWRIGVWVSRTAQMVHVRVFDRDDASEDLAKQEFLGE